MFVKCVSACVPRSNAVQRAYGDLQSVASVCVNLSLRVSGIFCTCMSECVHTVLKAKVMMRRSESLMMECFQMLSAGSLGLFI